LIKSDSGNLQILRVDGLLESDVTDFKDFSFDTFFNYFADDQRIVENFEMIISTETTSPDNGGNLVADQKTDGFEIDGMDFDVVPESAMNNVSFPVYLDPKLKIPELGDKGFDVEINKFLLKNFFHIVKMAEWNRDAFISTPDFDVHPLISGEAAAMQFIASHAIDINLVLVPYVVTKRIIGEDHVVLLVVKGNQNRIIDPKFGFFLGNAVQDKCIQSLKWQGIMDTTNCGFYVYHMITCAIIASMNGTINLYSNDELNGVIKFISRLPAPEPKEIRREMYKFYVR